jgi:uncharacterized damage-inducible protein DinB
MLLGFLDYYRAVLTDKASGLDAGQLATRLGPSTLTLGGLVNHMALVELWWFHQALAGNDEAGEPWDSAPWDDDPDWDFNAAGAVDPEELLSRYAQACARSREVMDTVPDLEQASAKTMRDGDTRSARWILIHMIEETARHAGHADLIRESIDGATGDFRSD